MNRDLARVNYTLNLKVKMRAAPGAGRSPCFLWASVPKPPSAGDFGIGTASLECSEGEPVVSYGAESCQLVSNQSLFNAKAEEPSLAFGEDDGVSGSGLEFRPGSGDGV